MKNSSIWFNQINFKSSPQNTKIWYYFDKINIIGQEYLGWEPEKYFIPHLKWSRQATHGRAALDMGWGIFILIQHFCWRFPPLFEEQYRIKGGSQVSFLMNSYMTKKSNPDSFIEAPISIF